MFPNMITILIGSLVNTIWWDLYDHLMSALKIFTFKIVKIFIWAPKMLTKEATASFGFINYVVLMACFISWEKWVGKKSNHLRTMYLTLVGSCCYFKLLYFPFELFVTNNHRSKSHINNDNKIVSLSRFKYHYHNNSRGGNTCIRSTGHLLKKKNLKFKFIKQKCYL